MKIAFSQKHVVVTGGTGALGAAVVQQLVDQGAHCHIPCYSVAETGRFHLREHDQVTLVPDVDLTLEESARAFYATLPSLWASIHVAGGFTMSPVTETSLSSFMEMLQLNTVTAFLSCREAVKIIRKSEGCGRLVNIAARPAVQPTGGMIAYATSKAAVAAMTQHLAEELGKEGIFANALLPSVMDTPANRRAMPDADHSLWPKVAEIAHTIIHLASPNNILTNGALVPVYGRS